MQYFGFKKGTRLQTAFVLLLAIWMILFVTGTGQGFSTAIGFFLVAIGSILAFRFGRRAIRKSIWRLRNRLLVTYLLIGVVPIVLILVLVGLGGYFIAGQVAVYLVSSELERRSVAMSGPATGLLRAAAEKRGDVISQATPFILERFPKAEFVLRDNRDFRVPANSRLTPPPAGWATAAGVVLKEGRFYNWAHAAGSDNREIVMMEPLNADVLSNLVPNLGEVGLMTVPDSGSPVHRRIEISATDPSGSGRSLNEAHVNPDPLRHKNHVPPAFNRFDIEFTWANPIKTAIWDQPNVTQNTLLLVTTRPSALLATVFGQKLDLAQGIAIVFLIVALLFLVVEIVSLFIGVSLTRTITRAVHNLYVGTQKVTSGDFAHRIEVNGRDQLAELSASFNSMTGNLQRLVVVEKEKERLQSELEIAREVQNQLFPQAVPSLRTLELTGVCQPARMVSGDYYDFLCLQEDHVALAIGDVAGKGISAALLMASIQSIMRTQLSAIAPAMAADANGYSRRTYSTSHMVSQLNQQLYANTSPEKYATFCFLIYDEERKTLAYTNAGHLPPILIRNGAPHPLEVTGTVVGAFPMSRYEEQTISLDRGDLLMAYTDGISEPENVYGEEFGVDRMIELLIKHQDLPANEIIANVMNAVRNWHGEEEMPDDMTLMLARRI